MVEASGFVMRLYIERLSPTTFVKQAKSYTHNHARSALYFQQIGYDTTGLAWTARLVYQYYPRESFKHLPSPPTVHGAQPSAATGIWGVNVAAGGIPQWPDAV